MAIDETIWRPGDDTNVILRKILMATLAGGGTSGGGVASAVTVTSGSLTSAGAVTIADGADVAEGSRADATETNPANVASVISLLKGVLTAVNVPAAGSTSLTTIDNSIATTNTQLTTVNTKLDTISATIGQQRGALTDRSGSITTGATSQQLAAALATRKYFIFQNLSTETMWINFGVAAVADQPSISILPQASFVMETFFVSTQTINVISATTGSKFTAKEAI